MRGTARRAAARDKAIALDPLVVALQNGVLNGAAARQRHTLGPDALPNADFGHRPISITSRRRHPAASL